MTSTPNSASGATARSNAVEQANPQGAEAGPYVLNLCSSTTPLALAKAEQEELKRFSFFVSRRFEEGRERFRLHMGFFSTLAEAEEWLSAVRDIYPGAWAGEAPGKKLRERAAAAAAAQAQHAAGPQQVASPRATAPAPAPMAPRLPPVARNAPTIPVARPAPTPAAQPAAAPAMRIPTVHAMAAGASAARRPAPVAPRTNPLQRPAPRLSAPAPTAAMAPQKAPQASQKVAAVAQAASPATARPVRVATSSSVSGGPRPATPAQQAPPRVQTPNRQSARPSAKSLPSSNVREVLKALGETAEVTGETRLMPAPILSGLQNVSDASTFTDTQVLRLLETRRADGTELTGSDVESGAISLLKPDDTGTRRALKEAVNENAPVWFAVQLQWSVQPVELTRVPPLAIFSAYTLYTVEGSRDGRKWFGLRLGFFSDAISAKQVAYYVRSEFNSVAVVPVSPQERLRATDSDKKSAGALAFPKKSRTERVDEFKLIDSNEASPSGPAARSGQTAPKAPSRPAARKSIPNRVRARERRAPQTLEETLEILGASQLEIDNGRGETLNDSGVRHLRVEVQKDTPFSRLLERLSERVRKS